MFFLYQAALIPKPRFLQRRISELGIGTFKEIATVQELATVFEALTIFVERRVSALPVVNEHGIPHIKPHLVTLLYWLSFRYSICLA